MAPARGGGVGVVRGDDIAIGAGHTMRCAQGVVQVRIDGAGNVRIFEVLFAGRGGGQVKAAVKHHQRRAAVHQRLQFGGGNQGGVGHGKKCGLVNQ